MSLLDTSVFVVSSLRPHQRCVDTSDITSFLGPIYLIHINWKCSSLATCFSVGIGCCNRISCTTVAAVAAAVATAAAITSIQLHQEVTVAMLMAKERNPLPHDGITRNGPQRRPIHYGWPYVSLGPVHARLVLSFPIVTKDKYVIKSQKSFANRFPRSKNLSPSHRWGIPRRRCSRTFSMVPPVRITMQRLN